MRVDPTIAAVREVRHRISASVHHDPWELVEYYQRLQDRHRDRLVAAEPRTSPVSGEPRPPMDTSLPLVPDRWLPTLAGEQPMARD
jgi:hypothetical protein